jgi:hypothetical protein
VCVHFGRQIVCHDNRTSDYRPAGTAPNFVISSENDQGVATTTPIFVVDDSLCGSYTAKPLATKQYVLLCRLPRISSL